MAISAVKVMKWILIALNVLVLCGGAIAIGLGGWGLGSEYGATKLKFITGSEIYRGAAIAIIVAGCFLVAISFVGALGAYLENRWLLGTYFVFMLLILILYVTTAAVGFAFRDELREKLSRQMESSLINRYYVNLDNSDDNLDATNAWDDLQRKLDCCGVTGGLTSSKSWFLWQSSQWFREQSAQFERREFVPPSCCADTDTNYILCQTLNTNKNAPPQTFYQNLTQDNNYLNSKGCLTALEDYVFNRTVAIAGISVAILIVMFLCLLLTVFICTSIRKTGKGVM